MLLLLPQGAMEDLRECMKLAAAKERKTLQEELDGLQEQMDTEVAAAEMAAEAARAASAATYGSCTIEEVVDEPMEMFQVGDSVYAVCVCCRVAEDDCVHAIKHSTAAAPLRGSAGAYGDAGGLLDHAYRF
jgi:hypothetical protein